MIPSVVAGARAVLERLGEEPERRRPSFVEPPAPSSRRRRAVAAARLALAHLTSSEPDEAAAVEALELAALELLRETE